MSAALPQRWVLATGNAGKLAEFRALLAALPIDLVPLADLGAARPEETAGTFVENALIKARAAAANGLPAIADDSGLVVPALGGAPGILSARYAGPNASDADNMRHLLERMSGLEGDDRAAAFVCVVVAIRTPEDPVPVIAEGRWPGTIARSARGTQGFGYDPIFVDPASGLTAAELTPAGKNALSHRGRAVAGLALRLAAESAGS